ncbi:MAG: hypothetical protein M1818_004797 [Claussenomyces sp. TS43310]|nr:MAG: hypothetical protein M1818_004797 [Claussenomyces sp. TS43310]
MRTPKRLRKSSPTDHRARFLKRRQVSPGPSAPALRKSLSSSALTLRTLMITAAIRFELGDHHTYDFVEGHLPSEMFPTLREVISATDDFFSYADIADLDSCLRALDHLDAYVMAEGPFDAILAFSQGASIAASYLAQRMQRDPDAERASAPPFRCAIFFSAPAAYDLDSLKRGHFRALTRAVDGELIRIPTAHIWGRNDTTIDAATVSGLCAPDTAEVYVHEGGHEVPGVRMNAAVRSSVQIIRRVISTATYGQ